MGLSIAMLASMTGCGAKTDQKENDVCKERIESGMDDDQLQAEANEAQKEK